MDKLNYIITLVNMVVMVVLIIMISLQNKSAGLSNVFGGSGSIASTRRGADKWMYYATIITGVLFVGLTITNLLLRK
jgi:protein translocase SecG subunit